VSDNLEDRVAGLAEGFAKEAKTLVGDDPILQEAIVKMAVRDFAWSLAEVFPTTLDALHDQLGNMGEAIQDHMRKQSKG
jgi:hypothetical protein